MPIDFLHDEKRLLARIAKGDEEAFRLLFNTHYNKLAAFVLKLTKSPDITEELVQDVFVRVWLHRAELPTINNFESWIYIIARNHVFNQLRKIARENKQKHVWQDYMVVDHFETANQGREEEMYSVIESFIEQLPSQQKKIYLLKRRYGLKNEEIATQLNISLETVKKHFTLALRFIKNHAKQSISILIILSLFF